MKAKITKLPITKKLNVFTGSVEENTDPLLIEETIDSETIHSGFLTLKKDTVKLN